MPAGLHEHLIDTAMSQGVSMNQLICTTLAGALGWRTGDHVRRDGREETAEEREAAKWAVWDDLFR
jgi:hypothetical protein